MPRIKNPGDYPEAELTLEKSDFADNEKGRSTFKWILQLFNIHPRFFPHIQKIRITFVRRAFECWNEKGTKILT